MAGKATCAFDVNSGQETPVGIRDTPSQWYTANHRKCAMLLQLDGESTQQDSQVTQAATEGATPPGKSRAPVFAAAMTSQEAKGDLLHKENNVDEEETQIRMTNSEEQEGVLRLEKKISEEAVPLPIAFAASSTSRSVGDAGMGNSDDDSDMSDDMLEQDGSVTELSKIAALFRHREKEREVVQKNFYKPRTSFQASPALLNRDHVDSGGETEIEGEPGEKLPVKSEAEMSNPMLSQERLPYLVKSASCLKVIVQNDVSGPDKKRIRRELSTTEKTHKSILQSRTLKQDQREARDGSHVKTKRSQADKDETSLQCSYPTSLTQKQKATKLTKDDQHKHSAPPHSSLQVFDEITVDILEDTSSWSDEVHKALSRSASRPPCKAHTSKKCAAVIDGESAGSLSEGGSIRVILTGLDPTAAIREKIKSIAGAVYESNIEEATHVIARQNQLKRTVKLLCGISCCTHILGEDWLDQSARAGVAVDEQANCLHDEEAENKWQFDLRRTMYGVPSEQRQRLFAGYSVFITDHKSVLPPVKDLAKIVECAGGEASSKGKPVLNDVVITSEIALAAATVRKQLVNANSERIYSPELILSSVLQQRVDLDKHRLKFPAAGKRSK